MFVIILVEMRNRGNKFSCLSVKNWRMLSNNIFGISSHQYFKRNSVTSCFPENI